MNQNKFQGKIRETCRFWKERSCRKGKYHCRFIHGYVCTNDGHCWQDSCSRIHFNQNKPLNPRDFPHASQDFHKPSFHPRFRRSHSGSPSRYYKPFHHGRSPPHHLPSSRSPPHLPLRGYSPDYRHLSKSLSPPLRRFSRSRSTSRRFSRSRSRIRSHSRSRNRSRSWHRSRSRSRSPFHHRRGRGHSRIHREHSRSRSGSLIRSRVNRSRSISLIRSRNNRSRSLSLIRSRSKSPLELLSRARSPCGSKAPCSRSGSRSSKEGSRKSQPRSRSRSAARQGSSSGSFALHKKRHSSSLSSSRNSSPITHHRDNASPPPHTSKNTGTSKALLNLENLYTELDNDEPLISHEKTQQFDQAQSIAKVEAQLPFLNSETQQLIKDALKFTKENQSKKEREEQQSEDEAEDNLGLDLEEVGEEVDDIFAKSVSRCGEETAETMVEEKEGMEVKIQKELEAGSNPSPPKMQPPMNSPKRPPRPLDLGYHTDWELRNALDDPSHPLGKEMPTPMAPPPMAIARDTVKVGNTSLWTPALDRRVAQEAKMKSAYQDKGSSWEVETPYVGRKEKIDTQEVTGVARKPISGVLSHPLSNQTVDYSMGSERMAAEDPAALQKAAVYPAPVTRPYHVFNRTSRLPISPAPVANLIEVKSEASKSNVSPSPEPIQELPRKMTEQHSPRAVPESPKKSKEKHHKEKKKKRKKDSSDSDRSESSEREHEQKQVLDKDALSKEIQSLHTKKESLVKRVNLLIEQKNMMSEQRHDIIRKHKGSRENLKSILEENSFLVKEIVKQISNINNMVQKVDEELENKQEEMKQKPKPDREKCRKTHYKQDQSEGGKLSPGKDDRAKSPRRKDPSPHYPYNKQQRKYSEDSYASEQSGKRLKPPTHIDDKASSSPSAQKLPIQKTSRSPPKARDEWKPSGAKGSQQERAREEEAEAKMQYAPHEMQRTYMRYIDQGMHWCKLCSLFFETALEYVNHLMTQAHLDRVKNDRKSWLAKAPREEKEIRPPNAQLITVPLQGLEFLHSLPAYYCSLCDVFMRDKGESVRHPESKGHVSNYKVHRAKNPLLETTFLKAKTAAYAKYKIEEERRLMEDQMKLKEKTEMEIQSKLLRQVREKQENDKREERREIKVEKEDRGEGSVGSIRVASREQRKKSYSKSGTGRKTDHQDSEEDDKSPKEQKSEPQPSKNQPAKKNEESDSENGETIASESKTDSNVREDNTNEKEEDKKFSSTKLPLIGKMPFLKRRPGLSKSKEQLQQKKTTSSTEVKKGKAEHNVVSSLEIPLPKPEVVEEKSIDEKARKGSSMQERKYKRDNSKQKDNVEVSEGKKEEISVHEFFVMDECTTKASDEAGCVVMTFDSSSSDSEDSDGESNCSALKADKERDDSKHCAASETLQALAMLNIQLPDTGSSLNNKNSELRSSKHQPTVEKRKPCMEGEINIPFPLSKEAERKLGMLEKEKGGTPTSSENDITCIPFPITNIPLPPATKKEDSIKENVFEPHPFGSEESTELPMDIESVSSSSPLNITGLIEANPPESVEDKSEKDKGSSAMCFGERQMKPNITLPPGTEYPGYTQNIPSMISHSVNTPDYMRNSDFPGSGSNSLDSFPSTSEGRAKSYSVHEDLKPIPVLTMMYRNWRPPPPRCVERETIMLRRVEREATPPPPGTEFDTVHPPPEVEIDIASPPPGLATETPHPPPKAEMDTAHPPPKAEMDTAHPPPKVEMDTAHPPPKAEMDTAHPPPKAEMDTAHPPPKGGIVTPHLPIDLRLPDPNKESNVTSISKENGVPHSSEGSGVLHSKDGKVLLAVERSLEEQIPPQLGTELDSPKTVHSEIHIESNVSISEPGVSEQPLKESPKTLEFQPDIHSLKTSQIQPSIHSFKTPEVHLNTEGNASVLDVTEEQPKESPKISEVEPDIHSPHTSEIQYGISFSETSESQLSTPSKIQHGAHSQKTSEIQTLSSAPETSVLPHGTHSSVTSEASPGKQALKTSRIDPDIPKTSEIEPNIGSPQTSEISHSIQSLKTSEIQCIITSPKTSKLHPIIEVAWPMEDEMKKGEMSDPLVPHLMASPSSCIVDQEEECSENIKSPVGATVKENTCLQEILEYRAKENNDGKLQNLSPRDCQIQISRSDYSSENTGKTLNLKDLSDNISTDTGKALNITASGKSSADTRTDSYISDMVTDPAYYQLELNPTQPTGEVNVEDSSKREERSLEKKKRSSEREKRGSDRKKRGTGCLMLNSSCGNSSKDTGTKSNIKDTQTVASGEVNLEDISDGERKTVESCEVSMKDSTEGVRRKAVGICEEKLEESSGKERRKTVESSEVSKEENSEKERRKIELCEVSVEDSTEGERKKTIETCEANLEDILDREEMEMAELSEVSFADASHREKRKVTEDDETKLEKQLKMQREDEERENRKKLDSCSEVMTDLRPSVEILASEGKEVIQGESKNKEVFESKNVVQEEVDSSKVVNSVQQCHVLSGKDKSPVAPSLSSERKTVDCRKSGASVRSPSGSRSDGIMAATEKDQDSVMGQSMEKVTEDKDPKKECESQLPISLEKDLSVFNPGKSDVYFLQTEKAALPSEEICDIRLGFQGAGLELGDILSSEVASSVSDSLTCFISSEMARTDRIVDKFTDNQPRTNELTSADRIVDASTDNQPRVKQLASVDKIADEEFTDNQQRKYADKLPHDETTDDHPRKKTTRNTRKKSLRGRRKTRSSSKCMGNEAVEEEEECKTMKEESEECKSVQEESEFKIVKEDLEKCKTVKEESEECKIMKDESEEVLYIADDIRDDKPARNSPVTDESKSVCNVEISIKKSSRSKRITTGLKENEGSEVICTGDYIKEEKLVQDSPVLEEFESECNEEIRTKKTGRRKRIGTRHKEDEEDNSTPTQKKSRSRHEEDDNDSAVSEESGSVCSEEISTKKAGKRKRIGTRHKEDEENSWAPTQKRSRASRWKGACQEGPRKDEAVPRMVRSSRRAAMAASAAMSALAQNQNISPSVSPPPRKEEESGAESE